MRYFPIKEKFYLLDNFMGIILSFTFIIQILTRRSVMEVNTNQIKRSLQRGENL